MAGSTTKTDDVKRAHNENILKIKKMTLHQFSPQQELEKRLPLHLCVWGV